MSPTWENPQFAKRRKLKAVLLTVSLMAVSLLFVFIFVLNFFHKKDDATDFADALPAARSRPAQPVAAQQAAAPAGSTHAETPPPVATMPAPVSTAAVESAPLPAPSDQAASEKYQQARAYIARGAFELALPLLLELYNADKRYAPDVGFVQFKLGKIESALPYLEEAVNADPSSFLARKNLALAYYQANDLENCQLQIQAALALKPDPQLTALQEQIGRENRVQKNYIDAKTPNFIVQFDGREHQDVRATVISMLKEAYREVGNRTELYPGDAVTVILYSEKDFRDVTRAPEWAGGLFDGKIRIPVRGIEGQEGVLKRVLVHEYVHALVYSITVKCPRWLNEGLAEYFSEGARVEIGQWIPLEQLDKALVASNPTLVLLAYVESMDVVTDLIDRYGMYRVKELLELLGQGETLDEAFQKSISMPFSRYAARWRKEG